MKPLGRSNPLLALTLFVVAGCKNDGRTGQVEAGILAGTVTTRSAALPAVTLPEGVRKVCGDSLANRTIEVGPQGGLANAVVWIDDAPPSASSTPPLLDQKGCAYVPPVLVGHTSGKLKIRNSDALMHNVRAGVLFNVGMPIENQVIERTLPDQPGPITLVCDVHPWMRADVMVLPHSQWALTDSAGQFRLSGIAAGERPVRVWHPTLGEKSLRVTVPSGGEGKLVTEL